MSGPSAVVVGGGLAGISAALRLADAGRAVTVLESRPRLGGAAFSFHRNSPVGPLRIDNGQHVYLRCCTAYADLLGRLGVAEQAPLHRLDIPVLGPGGGSARLRRTPGVPAPAHLGAALAGYGLLGPADRARAVRGALALRRLDPADPALDRESLGGYLHRHGQSDAVIEALWGIVATATLNLPPAEASLALAAKVFRTGLLDRADAGDVGYPAVPLGDLHDTAARRALAEAGVEVHLGARVIGVEPDGGAGVGPHVTVRARTGRGAAASERTFSAEHVVLAMPHLDALATVPALAATPAAAAEALGSSPIVNVHVIYDRRVTDLPFAAAVHSPVQWFFDRTGPSGLRARNAQLQYLAVTVSAADGWIDVPSREVQDRFVRELGRLLPPAAGATVLDAFVTRERHATFRQAAGTAGLRPGPCSGLPGVALAGAWTATGWPDTMEGAVRSGVAAADAVLAGALDRSEQEVAA